MFKHMAVKTITITEEAYNIFKRLKGSNESFSDLIRRIGSERKFDAGSIFGVLPVSDVENARKKAKEIREILDLSVKQRLK